jgi:hypothetical protein
VRRDILRFRPAGAALEREAGNLNEIRAAVENPTASLRKRRSTRGH